MSLKEKVKSIMNMRILPNVYKRASKRPIEKGLVILTDCHHRTCPQAMEYFRDKLCEEQIFPVEGDLHLEEIYFDVKDGLVSGFKAMIHFMKRYAVAEFVVICDNHLPVASCKKRPQTKVIQLWHGGGALKKFGYDSEINVSSNYKGNNIFGNYDLVTVSAPNAVEPFTSAMRQPFGVVKPIGLPKSDFYHDETRVAEIKNRFYEQNPSLLGKKIVLWAPTFRGSASAPKLVGEAEIERIQAELRDEFAVISSIHPHAKNHQKSQQTLSVNTDTQTEGTLDTTDTQNAQTGKSRQVCITEFTSDELMCVADIMISDYSSIIYDWTYWGKPLILFVPDKDEYISSNGFYLDYEEIPGIQVSDYEQLKAALEKVVKDYEQLRGALKEAVKDNNKNLCDNKSGESWNIKAFYDKHMSACDGGASARVIQWMRENRNKKEK